VTVGLEWHALNSDVADFREVLRNINTLHDTLRGITVRPMSALSLVCGQCGLQLKSVKEAQEHGEMSGHTQFEESTEPVSIAAQRLAPPSHACCLSGMPACMLM